MSKRGILLVGVAIVAALSMTPSKADSLCAAGGVSNPLPYSIHSPVFADKDGNLSLSAVCVPMP